MQIQCECGAFRAQLQNFPRNTPGRLACYCDDCQTFAHRLNRADLLDAAGGTEVIPVYPAEIQILAGREVLKCLRLSPDGLYRWYVSCCNTPVANVRPRFPWVGMVHRVFTVQDAGYLERTFGAIRSRIMGRYARGTPPSGTAEKIDFKGFVTVLPFQTVVSAWRRAGCPLWSVSDPCSRLPTLRSDLRLFGHLKHVIDFERQRRWVGGHRAARRGRRGSRHICVDVLAARPFPLHSIEC
jgi:hypothetical protein